MVDRLGIQNKIPTQPRGDDPAVISTMIGGLDCGEGLFSKGFGEVQQSVDAVLQGSNANAGTDVQNSSIEVTTGGPAKHVDRSGKITCHSSSRTADLDASNNPKQGCDNHDPKGYARTTKQPEYSGQKADRRRNQHPKG
ncbi:hypothetical protein MCP1_540012 [Candidatus Terasakiella magnetica]|nr:hypothetical protein MCP1_540012 [Candidatus Terasakiella magnetica]